MQRLSIALAAALAALAVCARPGKPGVYARVAGTELREWIGSALIHR